MVSESECNMEGRVCETAADATYGDGMTRRQLAEAERTLVAKVPKPPRSGYFTKQDLHIASTSRCAAARQPACLGRVVE